jgi:lysophospholipase L1-like esterase
MWPMELESGNSLKVAPQATLDFIAPMHLEENVRVNRKDFSRPHIAASAIFLLIALNLSCGEQRTLAGEGHWVTTWGCGPQLTEPANLPPAPLANSTLRQFVHTTIGGKFLRVRFSNAYGTSAVVIQSTHVALAAGTGSLTNGVINPETDTALKFRGAPSVTIPPGEVILSDPCDFNLPPVTNLAVTIYFGTVSADTINGHPGSRTSSYIRSGNVVSASAISNAVAGTTFTKHWYIITGVDVLADSSSKTITVLGDSIADGRGSTDDGNDRWPDILAQRLSTNGPTANVGVVNMGIGANAIFGGAGPAAVNRFDRDMLNQSGVRWMIIFEGVNDIGSGTSSMTTATNLVNAYINFANKAHARGIFAYGATITPFGGNSYFTTLHEAERQYVNTWFRTNTIFDGVIDFDAAVRDPVTLTNFQSAFFAGPNANDWLHMNPAGYKAMGDAINLNLFGP